MLPPRIWGGGPGGGYRGIRRGGSGGGVAQKKGAFLLPCFLVNRLSFVPMLVGYPTNYFGFD
jgi:hypothetical protein